jgi:hypothetical protein
MGEASFFPFHQKPDLAQTQTEPPGAQLTPVSIDEPGLPPIMPPGGSLTPPGPSSAAPEASTLFMMLLGFAGLGFFGRRAE